MSKNGFTIEGNGFIEMQAALTDLRRRFREHATLTVGWDDRTNYTNGTPVAIVARAQEYGATIQHPGGTDYGYVRKGKRRVVRFLKKNAGNNVLGTTGPHTIKIPARPFIRPAIAAHGDEWRRQIGNDIGKTDDPLDVILERVGGVIAGNIQESIMQVSSPPLAPSTRRARLRKPYADAGTAVKPLVASGVMLKTIRSVVTSESSSAPSSASAAPKAKATS